MKKSIIAAGAASIALAAMPVVGVFAATDNPSAIEDTINVTIADSCTWSRTLAASDSTVTASGSTLSATMTAPQTIANFGTSTLNVKCNNTKGYAIKATMTGLAGQASSSDATSNNDSIDYAASLAAGKWTASYNNTGIASGNSFVTTSGADDMENGTNYVITYGVQTKANQAAGFYTGTVTYELTQNTGA